MKSQPSAPHGDPLSEDPDLLATRPGRQGLPRVFWDVLGRWYILALGGIAGFFLSVYYLKKTPEQFASTATVLVKQKLSGVIGSEDVEDLDIRSDGVMNTIAAQITRVELLERVAARPELADREDLFHPPVGYLPDWVSGFLNKKESAGAPSESRVQEQPKRIVGLLKNRTEVNVRRRTRLLDVRINHEDPEVAAELANAVVDEYLKELTEENRGTKDKRSQGLVQQAEEARVGLQDATSALAVYNRAIEAHKLLEAEEVKVADLARRYRAKHPQMISAVAKLKNSRDKFMQEFLVAASSEADSSYWKGTEVELKEVQSNESEGLATARRLLLARTQVLDGETKSRMSVFNSILVALEESKVNSIDEEVIAELHSRAAPSGSAVFPNRLRVQAVGGIGGVASGLGLILLLLRLDNRFRTVSQVEEETGMPVLAAVPVLEAKKLEAAEKSESKSAAKTDEGEGVPVEMVSLARDVVFRDGLHSSLYAESYRILRAAVMLLGDEKKRKISAFSSALPGEGKTTTSVNYALALASQGKKTLLMDMDLRKPKVHRQFNLRRGDLKKGMSEVLSNQCDASEAITKTPGIERLDAIFAGGKAPNPGELLREEAIVKLFEWAREHYDHIVIDSAPILPVPDTRIIFPLVDNPCLVIRANVVPKPAVFRALDVMEEDGSRVVGVVLNGYRETRRLLGYNYSYGSYRYGKYGYSQYGYGGYGSYGSYGSDDDED